LAEEHAKLNLFDGFNKFGNPREREAIFHLAQLEEKKGKKDPLVSEREKLLQAKRRQLAVARCNFEETAAYSFLLYMVRVLKFKGKPVKESDYAKLQQSFSIIADSKLRI